MLPTHRPPRRGRAASTSARLAASTVLLAALGAGSCTDSQGRFDEYIASCTEAKASLCTPTSNDGSVGGPCRPPDADGLDGKFLLAVASSLGPDAPNLFEVEIDGKQEGDRVALSMFATPLHAQTHEKVGTTSDTQTFYIEPDGHFSAFLPADEPLPGEANALTPGLPVLAETTLEAYICQGDEDENCGIAKMNILSPALGEADGTFGMRRIEGDTLPEPLSKCAEPAISDAGADASAEGGT